jgi:hypothetical protein
VWRTKLKLPTAEPGPIIAEFNLERIAARPWSAEQKHITTAELTY